MRMQCVVVVLAGVLAGCSSAPPPAPVAPAPAITAAVESDPVGAQVFRGERPMGAAPLTVGLGGLEEVLGLRAVLDGAEPVETRIRWIGADQVLVRFRFGEPSPLMKKLNLARVLVFDFSAKTTFDVDRADIKPEFAGVLQQQAQLLKAHFPSLGFYVCGHTDSTGGYEHNVRLSLARAQAVRDFLAAHGVAAENMTVFGFGPDFPEADNGTPEGRALNRRTELVLPQP